MIHKYSRGITYPTVRCFALVNRFLDPTKPYIHSIVAESPYTKAIYNEWITSENKYLRKDTAHSLIPFAPAGVKVEMYPFTLYDYNFHDFFGVERDAKGKMIVNKPIQILPTPKPKLLK